jgi:hypothetical protein
MEQRDPIGNHPLNGMRYRIKHAIGQDTQHQGNYVVVNRLRLQIAAVFLHFARARGLEGLNLVSG